MKKSLTCNVTVKYLNMHGMKCICKVYLNWTWMNWDEGFIKLVFRFLRGEPWRTHSLTFTFIPTTFEKFDFCGCFFAKGRLALNLRSTWAELDECFSSTEAHSIVSRVCILLLISLLDQGINLYDGKQKVCWACSYCFFSMLYIIFWSLKL